MKIAGDFRKIVSVLALRVTSICIRFTTRFFYCSLTAGVPLLFNRIRQMVSKKNRNFMFKIFFFFSFKNYNILALNYTPLQKVKYLLNESSDL